MTPPHDTLRVRAATEADLPATAHLHARLLPHGLFPRLGERFLQRWHATFLDTPHGVAFVAVTADGDVRGFLMGTTDQVRYVDDVIARHRLGLTLAGVRALLTRPHVASHFLRTRAARYARRLLRRPVRGDAHASGGTARNSSPATRSAPVRVAVVTAVAVGDGLRGSGTGARLVSHFLAAARAAGTPAAELVTKADGHGASAFYERLGWSEADVHRDRDGDLVRRFRLELGSTAPETRNADRHGAA
jgi:ribosomal protein S18 acetylase RimI-like enzyme